MKLPILKIAELTGVHRDTISKRLADLPFEAGKKGATPFHGRRSPKARRHQSGTGGSGDAAGVATGDDEEVELLAAAASYFSSRVFCLA